MFVVVFNLLLVFNLAFAQKSSSSNSVLEQFKIAQDQSKSAQATLSVYAIQFSVKAANSFNHGDECQKSCPFGCCEDSAGLIAEGGLYILYNREATNYANSYAATAIDACKSSNQLSSSVVDCANTVKNFKDTLPESNWYNEKGLCKSTAPEACQTISSFPGGSQFGKKYLNCKQSGSCQDDFYSTYKPNSDGSINVKINSKVHNLTLNSFKDPNNLIKLGLSKEIATALVKQNQILKNNLENKTSSAMISNQAPSAPLQDTLMKPQELEVNQTNINQFEKNNSKEKLTSLTVNYNGEPIHINSADLFKMISIRYQLELKNFIEMSQ